jgi:hypothetical protein
LAAVRLLTLGAASDTLEKAFSDDLPITAADPWLGFPCF